MYYTLEKAAEVLGVTPGDLNRLREAGKIRAFRDGNTWKFRKEDVDNHLTEVIKSRSSDSLDSDLLNDSDEELPTMLADSNSFESLAGTADGFKISAREPEDDDVFIDDSTQSGNGNVLETDEPRPAGSSGISLIDEEDDVQLDSGGGSDSGISLIDDGFAPSSSNVDLGAEDIVLGGSNTGSDSGLSLLDDDGLTLGSVPGTGSDADNGSGISLLDDNDPFTLSPELNMELTEEEKSTEMAGAAQTAPVAGDADIDEIFELDTIAPDEADTASGNETYDLVANDTDSQPSTTTHELDLVDAEDEDFQLNPFETQETESDSDSASQVIALDTDSPLFQTEEDSAVSEAPNANMAVIPDETEATGAFGGGADSFASGFDGESGGGFDAGGGFGDTGFNGGDITPIPEDGGLPLADATIPASDGGFPPPSGGDLPTLGAACPYTEGKGCVVEPNYSGMSIGLGLVPCILVLVLAGIGVYELVRVIWSWDQPLGLTGSVLETIGGLLKLF